MSKKYELVKPSEMKNFGSTLVQAAEEAQQTRRSGQMVEQIRQMVEHLQGLYVRKEKLKQEIETFEGRLAAIEKGEFALDIDSRVIYKDKKLRP
jgi:hypothetical protein